jgi:DNA-binding MarR family transcriptional regulator
MTKTVNLLEEHGYVEKQPDAADSRAVLVSLTDAGADALAERTKDVVRVLLPELGELSESERRTLDEAARILGRHLDGRPRAVSAGTTSDQIARTQEKQESTESE